MIVAIIILAALMVFQFVNSIEKNCVGLAFMFGAEILLFAFIARNISL